MFPVMNNQDVSWFAIQTKPNLEDIAAINVSSLSIEVMIPKIKQKRVVYGKPKFVTKPLFSGYIFARFSPLYHLHAVQYTRGVRRVVSSGKSPLPVDDSIINEIISRQGEDGYINLDSKPAALKYGDRVIVREGPAQGLTGMFEREIRDGRRVQLLLDAINYQVRLLIEKNCIEPVANQS